MAHLTRSEEINLAAQYGLYQMVAVAVIRLFPVYAVLDLQGIGSLPVVEWIYLHSRDLA